MVPFLGAGLVGTTDTLGWSIQVQQGVAYALGLGAGAVWQLLYRRDLVDRSWPVAIAWALISGMSIVEEGEIGIDASTTTLVYFGCVILGLVLCERFLRWRDGRTAVAAAAAEMKRISAQR
ncbi:MAG: hypothetical protein NTX33_01610 [Propionibacteriales bacterium]|nr:hypothetical protein [Propionibacteriales bacterium]